MNSNVIFGCYMCYLLFLVKTYYFSLIASSLFLRCLEQVQIYLNSLHDDKHPLQHNLPKIVGLMCD